MATRKRKKKNKIFGIFHLKTAWTEKKAEWVEKGNKRRKRKNDAKQRLAKARWQRGKEQMRKDGVLSFSERISTLDEQIHSTDGRVWVVPPGLRQPYRAPVGSGQGSRRASRAGVVHEPPAAPAVGSVAQRLAQQRQEEVEAFWGQARTTNNPPVTGSGSGGGGPNYVGGDAPSGGMTGAWSRATPNVTTTETHKGHLCGHPNKSGRGSCRHRVKDGKCAAGHVTAVQTKKDKKATPVQRGPVNVATGNARVGIQIGSVDGAAKPKKETPTKPTGGRTTNTRSGNAQVGAQLDSVDSWSNFDARKM